MTILDLYTGELPLTGEIEPDSNPLEGLKSIPFFYRFVRRMLGFF